ncbi:type I-MYXAN CRISPR-associated Cas8a1/Cmx1 [Trichothermofontia sichuanensis B231]|uniref:type I-MYXAN CRISPR-associated Cas8a1/Cmx1 n=1 Tax=Trichothermofontia sichuanensis TaxID=3045816 RepID=UPI0022467A83|nr:type I-MYXAN CRISPR-associated Cas8a1/Cmx1 [Trichothermofontia sichuanensis]UZQ55105.1 type I-MYXAN CRISPR-associated Cas8a1/Cmx1 [Trichothermofontia sichuanensis B231]
MKLELDLGNPRYTLLHRAGLAGLYMTLAQLQREGCNSLQTLTWRLNRRSVCLDWQGLDLEVLSTLLKEAFRLKDGMIDLRGLATGTMRPELQAIVHLGMLGTFLQHTSTHKATGSVTKSFELEENKPPILVTYKALSSYVHQDFAKNLCDANGRLLEKPISVAGWLNPGAVVRHTAFSASTGFEELAEDALVLLFAPVACYYYLLRSTLRDKRSQYALIVPEINNLETYAECRHIWRDKGYKDFFATGLGDAALRFLTYDELSKLVQNHDLQRCQVLTLGTVAWASQQKTRTDLYVVEATPITSENYRLCREKFSDRIMLAKDNSTSFVAVSFAKEFIAENLAHQRAWYAGLADVITSHEMFTKLTYERGGLYEMVKKARYDDDDAVNQRDRLFVEACHEAIKYTYGKIKSNTKPGDDLNARFDRATTRMRSELTRCKSAEAFRGFITDFWARAGRLPTLQHHWQELMALINDAKEWRKARDLALLALASYKKGESLQGEEEDSTFDQEDEILIPDPLA